MPTLFAIAASGRTANSISRALLGALSGEWRAAGGEIDLADLALSPPPPVDEAFMDAAFTPKAARHSDQADILHYSDDMIGRFRRADALAIATPMYNFGMPAPLKAFFDQIIRPDETFAATGEAKNPYKGLIADRPTFVLTARGNAAFARNGAMSSLDLLDPHLAILLDFIGIRDRREYDVAGVEQGEAFIAPTLAAHSAAIIASARTILSA